MGFINKLLGKPEPATDQQIRYLQTLGNKATEKQFNDVLRANGHNPSDGASTILASLTEDQASALVNAFLNVEPFTDSQGNYITLMYRDFREWRFDSAALDQQATDAYDKMHKLLAPHIDTDNYYDRSQWTLSKRQASSIISAVKPQHDFLKEQ
jgi:hypothetical protein